MFPVGQNPADLPGSAHPRRWPPAQKRRQPGGIGPPQSLGGQFSRTEINFDTPGSSIVTPYSRSAISIVLRLWVIRMNCV